MSKCDMPLCDGEKLMAGLCHHHIFSHAEKRTSRDRREFILKALWAETDKCIVWPYASRPGGKGVYGNYPCIMIRKNVINVRRLVMAAKFIAPYKRGEAMSIGDTCGNELCINRKHLVVLSSVKRRHPTRDREFYRELLEADDRESTAI